MKILKRLPGLPAERALKIISGRRKTVILYVLLDGPRRTCELEARIPGISQKVLFEQLQALEEHGMVRRRPSSEHRQGIDYLLTPLGESLRPSWPLWSNGATITPTSSTRSAGFYRAKPWFEIGRPEGPVASRQSQGEVQWQ